jgi:hypothetical protein
VDIADDGKNDTYVDENGKQFVDNDVIQRSRLRVDARKWVVSKLLPKKYGERSGDINVPVNVHNYIVAPEKLKAIRERHARALEGYGR